MASNILIIDDMELDRILYKEHLGTEEYNFFEAADGNVAIEMMKGFTPDLILLDWQMPIMGGDETLKKLGEAYDLQGIPVIVITGMQEEAISTEAFDLGSIDFINKPVKPLDLKNRVDRNLQMSVTYMELKSKMQEIDKLKKEVFSKNALIEKLSGQNEEISKLRNDFAREAVRSLIGYEMSISNLQLDLQGVKQEVESIVNNEELTDQGKRSVQRALEKVVNLKKNSEGLEGITEVMRNLYPSFIPKLSLYKKDLNSNELKHSVYLKLGLSTEEVAELTSSSVKSTNVMRDHLRKIFSLNVDQSLSAFLKNI